MVTKFAAIAISGVVFVELQPDQELTPDQIKELEHNVLKQVQINSVGLTERETPTIEFDHNLAAHFEGEVNYVMNYQPSEPKVVEKSKKSKK